jgi:23S rRNA U2552 (ribose-2'-O)-methylase RlmE/FtsJ
METFNKPPWEIVNFVSIENVKLPPLIFLQDGWKENPHEKIMKTKHKISNEISLEEWEIRKKITNPYEAIFSGTEDNSFPSLAKVNALSRSYFKMVEMAELCGIWNEKKSFTTAHVCEGPGGFIQSMIDKAGEKGKRITSIYAMTLKPTKSHIPGWRHSATFLKKHPEIHLEYGDDDTGNILNVNNQKVFQRKVKEAFLFTADGGFDYSIDYTNQEQITFSLLLSSFVIGLITLEVGGYMIIKFFDMYSQATKDLILGTGTFFKKFTIYKPATSRPCNSERYFIGKGYLGYEKARAWIQHIYAAQEKHKQSPLTQLVKGSWSDNLNKLLEEQINWQENIQVQTIENTLKLDKNKIEEYMEKNLEESKKWCEKFKISM